MNIKLKYREVESVESLEHFMILYRENNQQRWGVWTTFLDYEVASNEVERMKVHYPDFITKIISLDLPY